MTMRFDFLLAAAVAIVPGAALAQDHDGHHDHGSDTAQESDGQVLQEADVTDHSAHSQSAVEPDPHAGHVMPAQEVESQADPHAGHVMPAAAPAVAGPPPEAFDGPEHAADAIFGEGAMALARRAEQRMHGSAKAHLVLIERLEARLGRGEDSYFVDGQAWYGGDIDKMLVKVEGEGAFEGGFEGAEAQALWSHAISPWFDLQTGVRYDMGPGDDRGHLVVGVQGLAPFWIELDAAAFLSDDGDLTATVEAEHDMRITQRLILQPRAELSFAAQDVPERRLGAGLTEIEVGLRLRYHARPRFAPYLGVEYTAELGETADRARGSVDDPNQLSFVAGVRAWF